MGSDVQGSQNKQEQVGFGMTVWELDNCGNQQSGVLNKTTMLLISTGTVPGEALHAPDYSATITHLKSY